MIAKYQRIRVLALLLGTILSVWGAGLLIEQPAISATAASSTATVTSAAADASVSTSVPTNAPMPTATPEPTDANAPKQISGYQLGGLNVSVGYADSLRPNSDLPVPWRDAPKTVYLGFNSDRPVDTGAIRLDNTTSVMIAVKSVSVMVHNATETLNLWGSFQIPPGFSAILAGTSSSSDNFDTSDYHPSNGDSEIGADCFHLASPENHPPQITIALADGTVTTLLDTGHVLDTGGTDAGSCPPGTKDSPRNESLQWRPIGANGVEKVTGTFVLSSSAIGLVGSSNTVVARLADASNVLPLVGVPIRFDVVSGPNAGRYGQVSTDDTGQAVYTFATTLRGTDVIRASETNVSGGILYSNMVTITWFPPLAVALFLAGIITLVVSGPGVVLVRRRRPNVDEVMKKTRGGQNQVRPTPNLHFKAVYPREIAVEVWHTLQVHAYLESTLAGVQKELDAFQEQWAAVPSSGRDSTPPSLIANTDITILPTCEGVTFEPARANFRWGSENYQSNFRFFAKRPLAGGSGIGQVAIYVGPLLVGMLTLPMFFLEPSAVGTSEENSVEVSGQVYKQESIFVSYSHADMSVVTACRNAYRALGYDVLIDLDNLRSGQYWNDELKRLIDRASIFQLFWSERSAMSEFVREEWTYALTLNRGEGFIRPVYWEKPMPPPPPDLAEIHFAYMPIMP